jgi:hypothetical protein
VSGRSPSRDTDYGKANPNNYKSIFTSHQLTSSLRATHLGIVVENTINQSKPGIDSGRLIYGQQGVVWDISSLLSDIWDALLTNTFAIEVRSQLSAGSPITQELSGKPQANEWTKQNRHLLHSGCVYVPDSGTLRLRVLQLTHDHPLSGHFGNAKTYAKTRMEWWWPRMSIFVRDYILSCTVCHRAKPCCKRPSGYVQMLPVADCPWDSIQMDFIKQLPESSGYMAILVIIDQHSKQGIFLPTHGSINTPELVCLFVCNIFSKHRVPSDITSDCGSEFISHFFCSVGATLNVRLHYTSGYHPQANSRAEHLNQTLETYIRMDCNYQQDNWADLLPIAKFAYNNSPHESTRLTPFFVNKGYHSKMTNDPDAPYTSIAAHKYMTDLAALHDVVHEQITASNKIYKEYADQRRVLAPEFPDESMAYVKAKFFRVT